MLNQLGNAGSYLEPLMVREPSSPHPGPEEVLLIQDDIKRLLYICKCLFVVVVVVVVVVQRWSCLFSYVCLPRSVFCFCLSIPPSPLLNLHS